MIYSFHGSPGSPKDFSLLEELIPMKWVHQNRIEQKEIAHTVSQPILIGYSWGCRELLRFIERFSVRPQCIILISPYLFARPASGLKKIIVNSPLTGKKILAQKGNDIMAQFLEESSYPDPVNSKYLEAGNKLKDPKVLQKSVNEKDIFRFKNQLDISCLIIYGTEDQTSSYKEQIKPLKQAFVHSPDYKEISKGGHALVWNRSQEVANIINEYLNKNKMEKT